MGGSLALAINEKFPEIELRICGKSAASEKTLKELGITKKVFSLDATAAANGASLVILATPVHAMKDLAKKIKKSKLAQDAIVTDIGSVKTSVNRELSPIFPKTYVGSHPMAGAETRGAKYARKDLFEKAKCIITPTPTTPKIKIRNLKKFWQALGCNVVQLTPIEHDKQVARISHLPHMMAAVTSLSAVSGKNDVVKIAANGFYDTTRIAKGNPLMWSIIARENKTPLVSLLRDASKRLEKLAKSIETDNLKLVREILSNAKDIRVKADRLRGQKKPRS